jgi:KaiC/GvpD/RAD55 family RecA-like ATPase
LIPELAVIKLCLDRRKWKEVITHIGVNDMPRELQGIFRCLTSYQEDKDDGSSIGVDDLANLYCATLPRDREYALGVFDQLKKYEASDESTQKLISSIVVAKLLREVSLGAYDVAEGRKPIGEILEQIEKLQERISGISSDSQDDGEDHEFVTDDLEVLVDESIKTPGLRWRLKTLNQMLGSLRDGDFGFIFARPETGKTTFLASEVSFMGEQLKDDDGPIIWFNNEEAGRKVMLRLYQASLGMTLTEILRDLKSAKQKFMALTKGKILLMDDAGLSKQRVEKICKKYKPRLIIFDQIDKIKGFDNDREDLRLGSIYQWARELAKTYAPTIGVCQADGSGEGQRWLTMAHVANAKTAKQAEADFILGIGKVHDAGYETIRFLHASKNKLIGDSDTNPEYRHGRMEVLIDADRARYVDIG